MRCRDALLATAPNDALVVTGTDTGIGKTVVAAMLTLALDAVYWKPVQAGVRRKRQRHRRAPHRPGPERFLLERYVLTEPLRRTGRPNSTAWRSTRRA